MHAAIESLLARVPEGARDLKLNLQRLMADGDLEVTVRWGAAVACAGAARNRELERAVVAAARSEAGEAAIEDGRAAAALMAMNNVYYRSRHMLGDAEYERLPAGLRMSRLARPATDRESLELMSLAASAVNGCEVCLQAHERVVREAGLSREAVNAALRIAATIHGLAVALELTGDEEEIDVAA